MLFSHETDYGTKQNQRARGKKERGSVAVEIAAVVGVAAVECRQMGDGMCGFLSLETGKTSLI